MCPGRSSVDSILLLIICWSNWRGVTRDGNLEGDQGDHEHNHEGSTSVREQLKVFHRWVFASKVRPTRLPAPRSLV